MPRERRCCRPGGEPCTSGTKCARHRFLGGGAAPFKIMGGGRSRKRAVKQPTGTRMANPIPFGSPHVCAMWAPSTCGEPDRLPKSRNQEQTPTRKCRRSVFMLDHLQAHHQVLGHAADACPTKGGVIISGWVSFWIPPAHLHVRPMGVHRTCRRAGKIELTPIGVGLNTRIRDASRTLLRVR